MSALLWIVVLLGTLVSLTVAADYFIKAAERIGVALKVEPFVIGLTLIAVGTSLPELITSIVAVTLEEASTDIVLGNVVGSNIANLCLVLGVVAVASRPIQLSFDVLKVDLPILIGSTAMLFLAVHDQEFSLFEAIVFLLGLVMYITYVFVQGKETPNLQDVDFTNTIQEDLQIERRLTWKEPLMLFVSAAVIYLSAHYSVNAIVTLSKILQIGEGFIALTALAIGTSLPELVVSIVAIRTGNSEIAVGNVLGSNVFNVFGVMGVPRLFGKVTISNSPDIEFSLITLIGVTLLGVFILQDKRVGRWEGWMLILIYVLFLGNLIAIQPAVG